MSILPSPWIGSWSYSSFFILLFSNLNNKSIGLMFPVSIGLPCIENLMFHLALLLTSCLVAPSNVTLFERIWESIPLKRILLCLSLESIETICLFIQTENNTSIIVPVYFKEFNLNERAKNWLLAPWCCTYLNRVNTASVYQNRSSIMH